MDLACIKNLVPPDVVIYGNLSPVELLTTRGPEEVASRASELLRSMEGTRNFILGSGCDLPIGTSMENIRAMMNAVRS